MTPTHVHNIWRFGLRVLAAFFRNRGILLAGGVGYNVLLSIVPLFTVLGVVLTHIVDEHRLLEVMNVQAGLLAPGHGDLLLGAVQAFLDSRDVIGVVGFVVLLFFSSFAFRMLEDAIAIIFHQPDVDQHGRSIWVSALLPYVYVLVLGVALLIVSVVSAAMDAISEHTIALLGVSLPLRSVPAFVLELSGFIGLTLLFTSIYKVLPVVRIAIRRALVGGFTAAVLWEIIRFGVAYWFANVSLVNVVYGSFATIIVVLLSLEIGAVILLLGAQVIAELESSAAAGLPWYVDRRESRGDPFEPD
jgi:YihY family inner membrane protein